MTDPRPLSDDELDLAASLAIDGQSISDRPLAPGDDERIEARAAELRPVAAAVGEPVAPPPAEVRARQIATATAATAAAPAPDSGPRVDDAARIRRRSTRRRRVRSVAPWATAAAAAAVIVVVLASMAGRSGTHSTATSSASKSEAAAGASGGSTTIPPTPTANPSVSADGRSGALPDLGTAATADALADLARRAAPTSATPSGSHLQATAATTAAPATFGLSNAAIKVCVDAVGSLHPPLGEVVLQARATLGSRPVTVLVYVDAGQPDGRRQLVAFDGVTCHILVDRAL